MRFIVLTLAVLSLSGSPVSAQEEPKGPYVKCVEALLDLAELSEAPIERPTQMDPCFGGVSFEYDDDVLLRFSSEPALGDYGFHVTIRPVDDEVAVTRWVIARGHPALGWIEHQSGVSEIPMEQFARLREKFEAGIGVGPQDNQIILEDGSEALIVCTDGPGYKAQIVTNEGTSELRGFCGDHPNKELATLVVEIIRTSSATVLAELP